MESDGAVRQSREASIHEWLTKVQRQLELPDYIALTELPEDWHTQIDPIEEAKAMMGGDKVIVVSTSES